MGRLRYGDISYYHKTHLSKSPKRDKGIEGFKALSTLDQDFHQAGGFQPFQRRTWNQRFYNEDDYLKFIDLNPSLKLKVIVQILRAARRQFPGSAKIHEKLTSAEHTLDTQRPKKEKSVEVFIHQAKKQNDKKPEKKLELIQTAIAVHGEDEKLLVERAHLLLKLYRNSTSNENSTNPTAPSAVEQALLEVREKFPDNIRNLYSLADFYSNHDRMDDALATLSEIHHIQNDDMPIGHYKFGKKLLRTLGDTYLRGNCLIYALSCYQEALSKDKKDGSSYHTGTLLKAIELQSFIGVDIPFSHVKN